MSAHIPQNRIHFHESILRRESDWNAERRLAEALSGPMRQLPNAIHEFQFLHINTTASEHRVRHLTATIEQRVKLFLRTPSQTYVATSQAECELQNVPDLRRRSIRWRPRPRAHFAKQTGDI